jgi:hypothetical protein
MTAAFSVPERPKGRCGAGAWTRLTWLRMQPRSLPDDPPKFSFAVQTVVLHN